MKFQVATLSTLACIASGVMAKPVIYGLNNLQKRAVVLEPAEGDMGAWTCDGRAVTTSAILEAAIEAVIYNERAENDRPKSRNGTPYPHTYRNDGAAITFPRCTGPFTEFPVIATNSPFKDRMRPGPVRVVLQIHNSGENGSAEICGVMKHNDPNNEDSEGFHLCDHA